MKDLEKRSKEKLHNVDGEIEKVRIMGMACGLNDSLKRGGSNDVDVITDIELLKEEGIENRILVITNESLDSGLRFNAMLDLATMCPKKKIVGEIGDAKVEVKIKKPKESKK